MKKLRISRPLILVLCVCTVLLSLSIGALLPKSSAEAASASVVSHLLPHRVSLAQARRLQAEQGAYAQAGSAAGLLPCLNSEKPPKCYSPQQMRKAYGIQPLLDAGITGKKRTIAIIDFGQSPTLRSDLSLFDKIFGINDPKLNIIAPFGLKPYDPKTDVAFAEETTLDVEWAHAVAPDATINLVLANFSQLTLSDLLNNFVKTTKYTIDNNLGDVLSLSIGSSPTCYTSGQLQTYHQLLQEARAKKISVFVAAGDTGAASPECDTPGNPVKFAQGVSYPQSDPLVTGVGGTTLFADKAGAYQNEITWNDGGATGGGFSAVFKRPAYQNDIASIGAYRGEPDVAYDADSLTGFPIVISSEIQGQTLIVPAGGTSIGAPQWAGIAALADQKAGKRLGFLNEALYRIYKSASYRKAFHDITTGNNTITLQDANGKTATIQGYNAGPGWDAVTGIGTPEVSTLLPFLLKYQHDSDGGDL